jgi:hypothetical protein
LLRGALFDNLGDFYQGEFSTISLIQTKMPVIKVQPTRAILKSRRRAAFGLSS